MNDRHLNDAEIQRWALEKTTGDADSAAHILHCASCQTKATQYEVLFAGIQNQEPAIFDFDVTELVMKQLPKQRQPASMENLFIYFIITLFLVALCYLFGNNLRNLIFLIEPVVIGLIIIPVTSLLLFLGGDMYKKYQRQLQHLNQLPV